MTTLYFVKFITLIMSLTRCEDFLTTFVHFSRFGDCVMHTSSMCIAFMQGPMEEMGLINLIKGEAKQGSKVVIKSVARSVHGGSLK